ncbi:uncharacterized protein EAF01_001710 [Botrytis porri]|uniref:uncharacterized protein n=1 Tax=Botrytis porri TaxID=87229 RepID=UPI0019021031|nr:uncharacterized protein EAF01_001710 [Botrytis porri]KAF7912689.1 hypothetical protein EAF01_001710 [Botrytis porri]
MSSIRFVSRRSRILSPLSSPAASPRSAAESTTGDSESIDSLSQSSLSTPSQGMRTTTQSPTFHLCNPATNGSDSNQTLTPMDPVSESSEAANISDIPGILGFFESTATTIHKTDELEEKMDLDEPHQVGSSHPAKNAISNTESKKRESVDDESHQAGTSRSAKKPRKNVGITNGDLDENNIIPDTDDSSGMRMTRAKIRSVGKKIGTTNYHVNESRTAQSSNSAAIDAAVSQNNTRVTLGGQRKATNVEQLAAEPLPEKSKTIRLRIKNTAATAAQRRGYSVKFEPKPYISRAPNTFFRAEKREGKWSCKKQERRVPVGDAQYIWLQSQPKSVRDNATEMDREGTSDPFGTFLKKTRKTLSNRIKVEDSLPVQYMSQIIKDRHTPISKKEQKRMGVGKSETFTFRTYFPTSALVQCSPSLRYDSTELNVEFIKTVLETKSRENLKLMAKIKKAIQIQKREKAKAAEAAKVARAARVARGLPVPPVDFSSASPGGYTREGLECEMILDDDEDLP